MTANQARPHVLPGTQSAMWLACLTRQLCHTPIAEESIRAIARLMRYLPATQEWNTHDIIHKNRIT